MLFCNFVNLLRITFEYFILYQVKNVLIYISIQKPFIQMYLTHKYRLYIKSVSWV